MKKYFEVVTWAWSFAMAFSLLVMAHEPVMLEILSIGALFRCAVEIESMKIKKELKK